MRTSILVAINLLLVAARCLAQPDSDDQRAPFTDIRFDDGAPLIEVEGQWYRWLALDDIPIEHIEAAARRLVLGYPDAESWQHKRMAEDLVWVLATVEYSPGETVHLKVAPMGEQPGEARRGPQSSRSTRARSALCQLRRAGRSGRSRRGHR